jgi:soluble lytic murein transglycosylase-like protein
MATYGQGAWAYGFLKLKKPVMFGVDGDRLAVAILAIKREFIYNGYPLTDKWRMNEVYGEGFVNNVVIPFQKANGFNPPAYSAGTIGPDVAGRLWRKRTEEVELKYNIPNDWLGKMRSLESANDPCAIGWLDKADRGLVQINGNFHPEVTDAQAFDPAFSLDYGGRGLYNAFSSFGDWEVAVAAHNVGTFGASKWLEAGKPATGGIERYPSLYARATNYVNLVRGQKV